MTSNKQNLFFGDENIMEKSNQNALAQILSSSSTGSQLNIIGDFGNGSTFVGTDLDDTLTISGNLVSNVSSHDNSYVPIKLQNGNDTLSVTGKTITGLHEALRIEGEDGDKNIAFGNNIENSGGYFSVRMRGQGNYNIAIDGDLITNAPLYQQPINTFVLGDPSAVGYSTHINILGNVNAQRGSNLFWIETDIASLSIGGDVIASGSNDFIFYSVRTEVTIEGTLSAKGGRNRLSTGSNEGFFTFGSILSDSAQTSRYFTVGRNEIRIGNNWSSVDDAPFYMTVNGSIEAHNYSANTITSITSTILEVNGDVISQNNNGKYQSYNGSHFTLSDFDDSLTFLGNFLASDMENIINTNAGNDDLYIEGNIHADGLRGLNLFDLGSGDDVMTLIGNVTAMNGGKNQIDLGSGDDLMTLIGNVTATNGGKNQINAGSGDDVIELNGHIDAGALLIDGGEGNDTLVLTATTSRAFESNYKDWLVDLSSSGLLASNIETIRLDVRNIQPNKIGWLTDLITEANAQGANITLENRDGNVIIAPPAPPAAANASQSADSAGANTDQHSTDSVAAREFANDNYNQIFDQHAQTALVV